MSAWFDGQRMVSTMPKEREALIAWFDSLPKADPRRQELSFFIYKIRRAHKRAGGIA